MKRLQFKLTRLMVIVVATAVSLAFLRWLILSVEARGSLYVALIIVSGAVILTGLAGILLLLGLVGDKLVRWLADRKQRRK